MYAADRFDHLFNQEDAVIKKLNAGYHVICTRYVFSSLAYNCTSDDDLRVVSGLNKEFPDPDILIFIVNHVDDSMERIRKRETIEIYENQERLQRVRENYFKAIDNYHGEVIYVDGQNSIQQIHLDIIENIEKIRNEES
ncbi:Thymidylate kinase [compost metagenome]